MLERNATQLSRRKFGGLALSTAAVLAARTAWSEAPQPVPAKLDWIDAHVHVWSPDVNRYPLDADFAVAGMQPPSFTAEELFSHCRPAGVQRVVLIQMSFYKWDHRYMLEVMREHPGVFAGVALIDHRADDVVQRMQALADVGMCGFRLHAQGDAATWPQSPTMAKLWKAAGDSGLRICPLINPADIPHVAALCTRFPETTVVIDHFARVGITGVIEPQGLAALCDLAKHPQVFVKTSAFYALGKKQPPYDDLEPMIRRVCDAFGPERLMWASDCPFQVQGEHTYKASIALIQDRIDWLSEGDKQWLLRDTAEKVFFEYGIIR